MARRLRPQRLFTVSKDAPNLPRKATKSGRSRVLTDSSGYAAAEFNFPYPHFSPPLIITEPNEETSSWE